MRRRYASSRVGSTVNGFNAPTTMSYSSVIRDVVTASLGTMMAVLSIVVTLAIASATAGDSESSRLKHLQLPTSVILLGTF